MLIEPTYDRPSDTLGRGKWATEPWVIVVICVATFVVVAALLALRLVLKLRARRMGDGPISSRRGSLPPPPRPQPPGR